MQRLIIFFLLMTCVLTSACSTVPPTNNKPTQTSALPLEFTPAEQVKATEPVQYPAGTQLPDSTAVPASTPTAHTVEHPAITASNAVNLRETRRLALGDWAIISALAWSPDGKLLAVSSSDYLTFLQPEHGWKNSSAKWIIGSLTPAIAFSPDGRWFAAGSRDGQLRVWDTHRLLERALDQDQAMPTPAWQVEAHQKGVNSVAFNSDSSLLASGGNDAVARIWSVKDGDLLGMLIGGTFAVPSIAFAPGSTTLAVANGEYIRLRDASSERITGTILSETPLYTLEYSPDGRLLVAGDISNHVSLWDPTQAFRTGSENYPPAVILEGSSVPANSYRALVWDVVFSPDGSLLASAAGDGIVRVWGVSNYQALVALTGHTKAATSLVFSPDGQLLVSGGLDGNIIVWAVSQ